MIINICFLVLLLKEEDRNVSSVNNWPSLLDVGCGLIVVVCVLVCR